MSKKDFMRGVDAATKANAAFMHKQAAATEELGKRIVQKIDEQGKIIDVILDTLNAQEKKELYDLQSAYDIADLGENEKEVLASFLLTLISKYGQDNDNQKDYYFAVKKHLGVTDVSPDFDLSLVENVDSRSELKAMLQTVCEFLFLKTGDTSFLDEFEDEIAYFGLSRKVIREIVEPIERIYDVLGLRGIVEHYIPADSEEETDPEHYGLIAPLTGELVFDDSNRDIPAGTEQVFENLRVVFPKQLHADGKIAFRNCELVFAYDGKIALLSQECTSDILFQNCEFKTTKQTKLSMISMGGKCVFKNCLFSGLSYRYGLHDDVMKDSDGDAIEYNNAFIDVDGNSNGTATLEMIRCRIEGCEGTFINADGNYFGNNFNVTIKDCLVEKHTGNFLLARYADKGNNTGVKILDSSFLTMKAPAPVEEEVHIFDCIAYDNSALIYVESTTFECSSCTFTDVNETVFNVSQFLGSSASNITQCYFNNCCQSTPLVGTIKNCEFLNMSAVVFGNCVESNNEIVTVTDSSFKQINGKIIVEYGKMEHCSFSDSTLTIEIKGKPTGKDSFRSEANDLTFVNCIAPTNKGYSFMDKPCFLQAVSYLDKSGICVRFNGCKFENCQTTGNYINTDKKVYGAFDRIKVITLGLEHGTIIK